MRTGWMVLGAAIVVAATVGLAAFSRAAAPREKLSKHECHPMGLSDLGSALQAIEAATQAVEKGEKDNAVRQLAVARKAIAEAYNLLRRETRTTAGVDFVNARCPMVGTPINPAAVAADLRREFQGKSVAFCCAACPAAWDKLPDAQKQAKLDAATRGP